jgi:hypothetical protein
VNVAAVLVTAAHGDDDLGGLVVALSARYAAVALGVAGVVFGGGAVAPGGAGAAAVAGPGTGWSIVASPNGTRFGDNTLMEVSAGSAASAWAVGYTGGAGTFRTMVQRWNGSRWAVVPSPNVSSLDNVLSGVDTVSADDAWAVGYANRATPRGLFHRSLIEHWNGSTWRVVPAPQAGTSDNDLWAVTALSATNVWAVGNQNVGRFTFRPLVQHWNGRAWTLVRVPSPPLTGTGASLFGVAAGSPRDIWAVGGYDTGTRFQPLVEHFNGDRWASIPAPVAGSAVLNRVSLLPSGTGWAVGARGAGPHARALIERFNGRRWAAVPTPQVPGSSGLVDVLALTPHLAWAVGSYSSRPGANRTLIEKWNGDAWRVTRSPGPRPSSELLGIAGTPQHLWAVGDALTNTLILRR